MWSLSSVWNPVSPSDAHFTAHAYTHSYNLGVLMFWIDGTAHSEDNRIRCKHSGQNQCCPPQYLLSAITNPALSQRPEDAVLSSQDHVGSNFTKPDKSLKHKPKHYWLYFLPRTPRQTQYAPPPLPISTWFPLSQVNTMVEKKRKRNTDFRNENHLWMKGGRGRRPSLTNKSERSTGRVKKSRRQA